MMARAAPAWDGDRDGDGSSERMASDSKGEKAQNKVMGLYADSA